MDVPKGQHKQLLIDPSKSHELLSLNSRYNVNVSNVDSVDKDMIAEFPQILLFLQIEPFIDVRAIFFIFFYRLCYLWYESTSLPSTTRLRLFYFVIAVLSKLLAMKIHRTKCQVSNI